jgi:hypothetical protein
MNNATIKSWINRAYVFEESYVNAFVTSSSGGTAGTGGTGGGGSSATVKPKIVVPVFDAERIGMTSGGVRAQDVFDPNRVGMTSGTTINLTVNGALDKEGTARTIVDTLNNSFYRGTGGAGNLVTA